MSALPREIVEKFLKRLSESNSDDIDDEKIEKLRDLLTSGGKPKVEDLVEVFAPTPGEGVK